MKTAYWNVDAHRRCWVDVVEFIYRHGSQLMAIIQIKAGHCPEGFVDGALLDVPSSDLTHVQEEEKTIRENHQLHMLLAKYLISLEPILMYPKAHRTTDEFLAMALPRKELLDFLEKK